ncbi:hypothetical protein TeGR_g12414, partial [Tetraparma gracilis]
YAPASHKRYSRKWVKIKKKMDSMPARWYLVTAIRKDGLLDDERDQHLSAEEEKEAIVPLSADELREKTMWLPPAFDHRQDLSLKERLIKEQREAEEAAAAKKAEEEEKAARNRARNTRASRKSRKKPPGATSPATSPKAASSPKNAIEGGMSAAAAEAKGEVEVGEKPTPSKVGFAEAKG